MRKSLIKGQRALITGASSGIGAACAQLLAQEGVHVVLTARRRDRLIELTKQLTSDYKVEVTPIALDVQDSAQVSQVCGDLGDIDILVNNAGLGLSRDKIQDGSVDNWDTMIDTNIKGFLYVIKAILPGMIKRGRGHIVNMGSIAGRECYVGGNVYGATKFAVRGITQSIRLDVSGTPIRVTEIAPGAVETEFSNVRYNGDAKLAKEVYQGFEPLHPEDIADAVVYAVTRPLHVNISEVVIYPQAQAGTTIYRTPNIG